MAKLKCKCGYAIPDDGDKTPYRATFIPDRSFYETIERTHIVLDILMACGGHKERKAWISEKLGDNYPENQSETEMIKDYFDNEIFEVQRDIFQCECCCRLWVQMDCTPARFTSFLPEDLVKCENILSANNN